VNYPRGLLQDAGVYDSLTQAQCRTLLATRTFGRVGVTSGGLPVILPVRYLYSEDVITFRSEPGTKLRAARNGDVLAFEVDEFDEAVGDGWSVLVLGRATVLTTEFECEFDALPTLDDAARHEPANNYVRLHCELVAGRRLAPFSVVDG
jgi:nitroimidazol reductase NimA-like FMN-containing flavoprotein (pyridoxamine 5'-phosphate oxidase superfamily)